MSVAYVDAGAITANTRAFAKHIPQAAQFGAVVKADGYGHGAITAARAALMGGATWLMVATVDEAAELRAAGLSGPLLVLSPTDPDEAPRIVRLGLRAMVASMEGIGALAAAAAAPQPPPPVHIKVDTGLGRYGVAAADAVAFVRAAWNRGVLVEGIATHFATADQPDDPFMHIQAARFAAILAALEGEGIRPPVAHAANSGATLQGVAPWELVRVGVALYGIPPDAATPLPFALRPALSVESRVARVFTVQPGESVGYGRTFVATRPTRAALVPLGYADGLPRALSNRGALLVRGHRCPLIGRVSMDQCVIALPDDLDISLRETVTVIGTSHATTQTLAEMATDAKTIAYELATRFGTRLHREVRNSEPGAPA